MLSTAWLQGESVHAFNSWINEEMSNSRHLTAETTARNRHETDDSAEILNTKHLSQRHNTTDNKALRHDWWQRLASVQLHYMDMCIQCSDAHSDGLGHTIMGLLLCLFYWLHSLHALRHKASWVQFLNKAELCWNLKATLIKLWKINENNKPIHVSPPIKSGSSKWSSSFHLFYASFVTRCHDLSTLTSQQHKIPC